MFHLLEFADFGGRLAIDQERLELTDKDGNATYHCLEDLDAVILASQAICVSGATLAKLGEWKIPLVVCDRKLQPSSVLSTVSYTPAKHDAALELQVDMTQPLRKRLWQKIIQAKIHLQATILRQRGGLNPIDTMEAQVQSGDAGNVEARAASLYWKTLGVFPKRDRNADDANKLFNYAYTILFSAFSRYICAASLHPHLGIHHHNQYNPFCLASDLMEPYRAFADAVVLQWLHENNNSHDLDRNTKNFIIRGLYNTNFKFHKSNSSLFNAIQITVNSFKNCLKNKSSTLLILPNKL